MNALCRSYNGTADAERAVQSLLAGGVPGEDILLLMGAEPHDARSESRGSFAGGSDGEGVFANADRDVVVTYPDGRERSRVAGHRTLKRLLVDAGLDDDVAEADVRALHDGRVLVLVTTNAVTFERATELITA